MAERTFESQMARLEEIVRLLERGEAPLNESMKLFEEGTRLSASLGKLLDKAEQKVTVMQENMQGELVETAICGRGGSKMTFSEQLKADIALIEPAQIPLAGDRRGLRPHFRGCKVLRDGRWQAPASGNRAGILPPVRRRYRRRCRSRVRLR